jgi:NitT/TauT family transport system substrate-binding protein
MPLLRRRVVIGMAAAAADPARVVAQTAAPVTIRAGMTPQVGGVPVICAQQSGLFRNAGLDVVVQKINSGAATAAALAGGGLDVGILNSVTVIEANAHGVGLSILFPNRMHVPGKPFDAAMVTAAASSIRSGRDLNGRTIGCTAIKGASWLLCRAWMDANGGDSTTAKFVEVPFSAIPVALESGRIDAV